MRAGDLAKLQGLMQSIDQTLLVDQGLPGRSWYKNLIYAPGRFTGYGSKTLPGVREAVDAQHWEEANQQGRRLAQVLRAMTAQVEEATKLLAAPETSRP